MEWVQIMGDELEFLEAKEGLFSCRFLGLEGAKVWIWKVSEIG